MIMASAHIAVGKTLYAPALWGHGGTPGRHVTPQGSAYCSAVINTLTHHLSQSFSQTYGPNLPTSLTYFNPYSPELSKLGYLMRCLCTAI